VLKQSHEATGISTISTTGISSTSSQDVVEVAKVEDISPKLKMEYRSSFGTGRYGVGKKKKSFSVFALLKTNVETQSQ
jgi:hypothetical protein